MTASERIRQARVAREQNLWCHCPRCDTESKVREQFTQATRTEPMRSLGYHGYCPECAVSFAVETPQLAIEDASTA